MVWLRTVRRLHWFKVASSPSGDHNPHTTFRSGRFDVECGGIPSDRDSQEIAVFWQTRRPENNKNNATQVGLVFQEHG